MSSASSSRPVRITKILTETAAVARYDLVLDATFNVLKAPAGPGWKAGEVSQCRPRPTGTGPYRRALGKINLGRKLVAAAVGVGGDGATAFPAC